MEYFLFGGPKLPQILTCDALLVETFGGNDQRWNFDQFWEPKWPENGALGAHIQPTYKNSSNQLRLQVQCEFSGNVLSMITSSNGNIFPRYCPFVRGIHRSPVNSPHKGQWRGALMFSSICVWINGWANKREAGDLWCYRAHSDVTVMENDPTIWSMRRIFYTTQE